ncbi:MAG: heme exporter protein CcmD [Burkholderiales bacterium]
MIWGSVNDFLGMGGYGVYVWGSYGVTLLVMVGEIIAVRRRSRAAEARVHRLYDAHRDVL